LETVDSFHNFWYHMKSHIKGNYGDHSTAD
jgi:hypothetical protein